jgi:DNA-binding response OmpR family regulator
MKKLMAATKLNNILVVDDTPQNLHLLVDILTEYDYKVRPVPNGKLALSAAKINPPDLILLDIMMPGLDGYEVCKQIKSDPKIKNIPVIFISAVSETVDKVKAFAVGGADFITKPFQMHEVLMRVRHQLAIKNLEQQLKSNNKHLRQTIAQLKTSQQQTINLQKQLALEKITLGIADKVNEPIAQIDNTIEEIKQFGEASIENIPAFLAQMSPQQQKYFVDLLKQAQDNKINTLLSLQGKQELKTKIIAKLNQFQLDDVDKIADIFIELGFDEEIEQFMPLLASENYWQVLDNAYLIINLHQSIASITESTDKVSKVISAFKDYCKGYDTNSGKRQANIEHTVEKALNKLAPQISAGIQIIKRYSEVATISCYPEALEKVWHHLIHNAVDAIGTHGIITINTYQQENNLIVDIIDTGESISPELLNQLCDPFFTTKSSPDNVGLGLAIAKQIVEQHNGTISVNLLSKDMSLPGNTKFTVCLPVR